MIDTELEPKLEKDDKELNIENIKHTIEAFLNSNFDSELIEITLYRFPKETPNKNGELIEKIENLDNFSMDQVGKTHGSGNYGLYLKIFKREINKKTGNSNKILEKWDKVYFTLGSSYDKFVRQNKLAEQIEDISFLTEMKKEILNKTGNSNNEVTSILHAFKEQMEQTQKLIVDQQNKNTELMFKLFELQKPQQNSGLDIVGLLGVLVPLMKPNEPKESSLIEKLLLMQMEKNSNSQIEMLKMFEKGLEMKKNIDHVEEKDDSIIGTLLENLPALIPQFKELLSPAAKIPLVRKKALAPHKPYIDAINENPEVREQVLAEMRAQGLSDAEIHTIAERAGVQLHAGTGVKII